MLNLTTKQRQVYDYLRKKGEGTFDLDEIVELLFGHYKKPQSNPRTRANSVVKTLANRVQQPNYIRRRSPIGRGHKASYSFKLEGIVHD